MASPVPLSRTTSSAPRARVLDGGRDKHEAQFVSLFCILMVASACVAASNPIAGSTNGIGVEMDGLKRVAAKFVELLDSGKLPGLSKDEHGKMSGYHLTETLKKDFFDSKVIDQNMLSDIKGCKDAYLVYVEITGKKYLKYFFDVAQDDVRLVSAYSYADGRWSKINGETVMVPPNNHGI